MKWLHCPPNKTKTNDAPIYGTKFVQTNDSEHRIGQRFSARVLTETINRTESFIIGGIESITTGVFGIKIAKLEKQAETLSQTNPKTYKAGQLAGLTIISVALAEVGRKLSVPLGREVGYTLALSSPLFVNKTGNFLQNKQNKKTAGTSASNSANNNHTKRGLADFPRRLDTAR